MLLDQQLQQFYENVREIEDFEISDDNPKQTHDNLLQKFLIPVILRNDL